MLFSVSHFPEATRKQPGYPPGDWSFCLSGKQRLDESTHRCQATFKKYHKWMSSKSQSKCNSSSCHGLPHCSFDQYFLQIKRQWFGGLVSRREPKVRKPLENLIKSAPFNRAPHKEMASVPICKMPSSTSKTQKTQTTPALQDIARQR